MILQRWWQQRRRRKASDLIGLGQFTPWIVVALLFYGLRRLEVWLHQHIFKMGWLVTNKYQTTTILYYAFFLPGILLNQLTIWTIAGFLNVRAAHSIAWPEKQEIGELKLNFVQLSKNVDSFRLAFIRTAPLIVGLLAVYHISNNILNIPSFWLSLQQGTDVVKAITRLTTAPDFWLWIYIAFTISNTMMPNFEHLRGWRIIIVSLVVIVIVLYAIGAGNQVIAENLSGPVLNGLSSLSSIFAVIIGLDIFMVGVLRVIEEITERITGDSAVFQNGKMVTMSRTEMLAQRAKALSAPKPKALAAKAASAATIPSGPPSVYRLQFPIPGPPGKEVVSHDDGLIITSDPKVALPAGSQPVQRTAPSVIPGAVTEKSSSPTAPGTTVPRSPGLAPSNALPASTASPAFSNADDEDESAPSNAPGVPRSPAPTGTGSPLSPTGGAPRPSAPGGSGSPLSPTPGGVSRSPAPTGSGSPISPTPGSAPRPPASTGSSSSPTIGGGTRPSTPFGSSGASPAGSSPRPPVPGGSPLSPTPSGTPRPPVPGGSPASPSSNPPARPAGTPFSPSTGGTSNLLSRPASPSPFSAPPRSPLPGAKPPLDDEDEPGDDDSEDDVSYEDFEDPA